MTEIAIRVDTEVTVEINRLHALVEDGYRAAVAHAIEAGRLLGEAKERIGHGGWLAWLAEHFAGSERTAQLYMRLSAHAEANPQHIADLSLRAALKAIAKPAAKEPRLTDEQLGTILPGLTAQAPPPPPAAHTDREMIVDATVVQDPPAALDDTQHRKWESATGAIESAQGMMDEASTDGLTTSSVASAVRDASHELRKGAKALEELAMLLDLRARREQADAA